MTQLGSDIVSYVIVVYDTDLPARKLFCEHFPNFRGGANPSTLSPYSSVPCEPSEVGEHLEWITKSLSNEYTSIRVSINIHTPRTWVNFVVPDELLEVTQKYKASLSISFSSPIEERSSGGLRDA